MIIRAAPTAVRKDIVQASHWKGPVQEFVDILQSGLRPLD